MKLLPGLMEDGQPAPTREAARRCLLAALQHSGKARVGFENSTINSDCLKALDNTTRALKFAAKTRALAAQKETWK